MARLCNWWNSCLWCFDIESSISFQINFFYTTYYHIQTSFYVLLATWLYGHIPFNKHTYSSFLRLFSSYVFFSFRITFWLNITSRWKSIFFWWNLLQAQKPRHNDYLFTLFYVFFLISHFNHGQHCTRMYVNLYTAFLTYHLPKFFLTDL